MGEFREGSLQRMRELTKSFSTWYLRCLEQNLNIGKVNQELIDLWAELTETVINRNEASYILDS